VTLVRWSVLALGLALLIILPFLIFGSELESFSRGLLTSQRARPFLAAAVVLLLALDVLLPVPSSLVGTAAGALLGFTTGAAASALGMTAGCLLGYWLGRRGGRPLVRRMAGADGLKAVSRYYQQRGAWTIVLTRAVPVLAEAAVLVAGVARLELKRFLVFAIASNLGVAAAYAAVGALAVDANSFLIAFAGSILLPIGGYWLARRAGRAL
jgi:uncharacterized membrane protein YdjX (TVP38/TMEM64 family)